MNNLQKATVAQAYYESLRALSLVQGWDKYVVTDGHNCMFVRSDYDPQEGESIFFLTTRNRKTSCELYKFK